MTDPETRDLAGRLLHDEVVIVNEGRLLRAVIDALRKNGITVERDDSKEIMFTAEGLRLIHSVERMKEGQ